MFQGTAENAKISAVDSLGSLVGWLGWERLRHRSPCPVPGSCASKQRPKAGQRLSPLLPACVS
jgi:hypothetical protein